MRDWRLVDLDDVPSRNSVATRSPHCRAGRRTSRRSPFAAGMNPRWRALEHTIFVSSTTFAALGLAEPFLRALDRARFLQPTPIQATAIPHLLAGRDLLGVAQTGTGKTAAFALPMLQHLAGNQSPPHRYATRALILAPTRELALQIEESLRRLGSAEAAASLPSSAASAASCRCSGCAPAPTSWSARPAASAT